MAPKLASFGSFLTDEPVCFVLGIGFVRQPGRASERLDAIEASNIRLDGRAGVFRFGNWLCSAAGQCVRAVRRSRCFLHSAGRTSPAVFRLGIGFVLQPGLARNGSDTFDIWSGLRLREIGFGIFASFSPIEPWKWRWCLIAGGLPRPIPVSLGTRPHEKCQGV